MGEIRSFKKNAKNFNNCVHPPLFDIDEEKTFLEIIPPPELHLMLGVVNTLFSHMSKEFEKESLDWAKACHVQRDVTHGSSGFNGNSCKKLLDNVDILRAQSNLGLLKYVKAFDDFKKVVTACFGKKLYEEYKNCINAFKISYLDLKISVTPKVHAVFFHVVQFCEKKTNGTRLLF